MRVREFAGSARVRCECCIYENHAVGAETAPLYDAYLHYYLLSSLRFAALVVSRLHLLDRWWNNLETAEDRTHRDTNRSRCSWKWVHPVIGQVKTVRCSQLCCALGENCRHRQGVSVMLMLHYRHLEILHSGDDQADNSEAFCPEESDLTVAKLRRVGCNQLEAMIGPGVVAHAYPVDEAARRGGVGLSKGSERRSVPVHMEHTQSSKAASIKETSRMQIVFGASAKEKITVASPWNP
jgi:hypothetical protein